MNGSTQPTLYKPHDQLVTLLEDHLDHIPKFLFRVSAPKTNGSTSSTLVQSAAADNEKDISDILSRSNAAEMLERHCLWRNDANDNLTSWTSSFLYAVQLAIYRKNNDWGYPDPSSIEIYILEARERPRGTFVGAVPLLEAYHVSNTKLVPDYIHHEYLSQGRLIIPQGEMTMITYQTLIDMGLHELYPPFDSEDKPCGLLLRVKDFRKSFQTDAPVTPTNEELKIARTIATNGVPSNEMRVVIMATLLSLKRRFRNDAVTLQAFQETGWCQFVTDKSLDSYSITFPALVPEHRQFVEMMYDIHADSQRQQQLLEVEALKNDAASSELMEELSRLGI